MTGRFRAGLLLLPAGMAALVVGVWAGLLRLGWGLPSPGFDLAAVHGPLMVGGFLGTLISLERAVALGSPWATVAPTLSGLGGLALLAGLPIPLGASFLAGGGLGLVVLFVAIFRRQPAMATAVMGVGSLAWLVGTVLWLAGWPLHGIVRWWGSFLVLTIAGERLELSRFLRPHRWSQVHFLAAVLLTLAGLVLETCGLGAGSAVVGLGWIALALWLFLYDVARRTIRGGGLTRYVAICLLTGYLWLAASGGFCLFLGAFTSGPFYDALLHSLFLGFVFAMIFAHAPIIFPAVLGLRIPFRLSFYAHLILLHLSLVLRISGDFTGRWPERQWGGLFNAAALALFLAGTARSVWLARSARSSPQAIPGS